MLWFAMRDLNSHYFFSREMFYHWTNCVYASRFDCFSAGAWSWTTACKLCLMHPSDGTRVKKLKCIWLIVRWSTELLYTRKNLNYRGSSVLGNQEAFQFVFPGAKIELDFRVSITGWDIADVMIKVYAVEVKCYFVRNIGIEPMIFSW